MKLDIRGAAAGTVLISILWMVYAYFTGRETWILIAFFLFSAGFLALSSLRTEETEEEDSNKENSEYKFSMEDMEERYNENE